MAVKASATITLSFMVDVKAVYRYYKLQASTASSPSVPTTATPSGWTDTEPTYTEGSTNTLYFVDKTVFTNDSFVYSLVSKSTSYEAAKAAYNKAVAANNTANDAKDAVDNKVGDLRNEIGETIESIGTVVGDIQDSQKDFLPKILFEEYKASIESTTTEINASFTAEIEKLREDLTTEVDSRSALIRMAMEGLGEVDEAGVEVGVSGSELSSMFTNKRLVFLRNKIPIITMSADNEMLEIKSVEIKEELQLGGFQWSSRPNGNMGLAWIGVSE